MVCLSMNIQAWQLPEITISAETMQKIKKYAQSKPAMVVYGAVGALTTLFLGKKIYLYYVVQKIDQQKLQLSEKDLNEKKELRQFAEKLHTLLYATKYDTQDALQDALVAFLGNEADNIECYYYKQAQKLMITWLHSDDYSKPDMQRFYRIILECQRMYKEPTSIYREFVNNLLSGVGISFAFLELEESY